MALCSATSYRALSLLHQLFSFPLQHLYAILWLRQRTRQKSNDMCQRYQSCDKAPLAAVLHSSRLDYIKQSRRQTFTLDRCRMVDELPLARWFSPKARKRRDIPQQTMMKSECIKSFIWVTACRPFWRALKTKAGLKVVKQSFSSGPNDNVLNLNKLICPNEYPRW